MRTDLSGVLLGGVERWLTIPRDRSALLMCGMNEETFLLGLPFCSIYGCRIPPFCTALV